MMDWDEATRAARGFMRGLLGPGYVPEYYQQFADEIVALMKACETPDPEIHTHDAGEYRDPGTGEVDTDDKPSYAEVAELLDAHAHLLRSFADRLK